MVPPGLDLLDQQAGRDRLPVQSALIIRMLALELHHQRRHREKIVAADIQHELWIGDVAVKIGEIIDLRHG